MVTCQTKSEILNIYILPVYANINKTKKISYQIHLDINTYYLR